MPSTSNVTSQWRTSSENDNVSTGDHDPINNVFLIKRTLSIQYKIYIRDTTTNTKYRNKVSKEPTLAITGGHTPINNVFLLKRTLSLQYRINIVVVTE